MKTRSVEQAFALSIMLAVCIFTQTVFSAIANRPRAERYAPRVYTGPEIPVCDKELWLRIKDGCSE